LRDADALSLSVASLLAAPVAIALAWYASRQHSRRPLGLIVVLGLTGVVVEAYLIVFG